MPAKFSFRTAKEGTYSHIYNKGVEKRIIFNDNQDCEVFLGYLRDYLSPPTNPESAKKVFTVNGRIFRGIPHQPKNYFNKVELIAYSLLPTRFHLLLHQITKGSLENFIRSLCTRYSMYFNKKYQRSGSLFEGPYKSVPIKDISCLLLLTRYFHQNYKEGNSNLINCYTSYGEYLGQRKTPWVNQKAVMDFFEKSENASFKGSGGYRNFVEKYELNQKEKDLLSEITIENESESSEVQATLEVSSEALKQTHPVSLSLSPRVPLYISSIIIFLLLLGLGVRNINGSVVTNPEVSPPPQVSGAEDVQAEPKLILTIKIVDGSGSVNIRQEPTTKSEKIGEVKDGDTFEYLSIDSGWYLIKLDDGSTGFVSERYVEVGGNY